RNSALGFFMIGYCLGRRFLTQCVQGLRNCRKLLRHKSNRNVIKSQYREIKNLYTLYYLHRLNTVVNLGMLGKISSYPTYPIAVILKMAMHLEDPERTALQAGTRAHDKSRIRVRDLGQLGVFVLFDGAHEFQFQGVQQAEVVGGVVSLVEDQRRFGDDRRSTGQLAEELVKSLQHLRKLPCVVAISLVDVVEQRQLTIGGAEQGVTQAWFKN